MKTAVVYDYLPELGGGGERALREVITHFAPDVEVFFGFVVDSPFSREWLRSLKKEIGATRIHVGPKLRLLKPIVFRIYNYLLPSLLQRYNFQQFDLVFSFTAFLSHSIIPPVKGKHLLYMNTPARFLWNLQHAHSILKTLTSPFLITDAMKFRSQLYDLDAIEHTKTIVAISQAVRERIGSFYGRNSSIVHPPSVPDLLLKQQFETTPAIQAEFGEYYTYAGRIESYKNLDLLLDTLKTGKFPPSQQVIIMGAGPYLRNIRRRLKTMYGPAKRLTSSTLGIPLERFNHVFLTGYIVEDKKMQVLAAASAFLSLNDEDFGITKVEALAVGTPVIALRAGGAPELIDEGKNGTLFDETTPESLLSAIEKHRSYSYNRPVIRHSAKPFTISAFHANLDKLLYA